jgi:hypothetical protein
VEVVGGEIFILEGHGSGFCGSPVLDSLVSFEMLLNQESFSIIVDPLEGV